MESILSDTSSKVSLIDRSSCAAERPLPSSSKSSKASQTQYINFIATGEVKNPAKLSDIWPVPNYILTHDQVVWQLKSWLKQRYPNADVESEKMCKLSNAHPIVSSTNKQPDVFINVDESTILIFEVISDGDVLATTRKLGIELCSQINHFRNGGTYLSEAFGFIFPVTDDVIYSVRCDFKDPAKYSVQCIQVSQNAIVERIHDVYAKQSTWAPVIKKGLGNCFAFPVTPEFITGNFGEGARQLRSGRSIVIDSPQQNSVFKWAYDGGETARLHLLLHSLQQKPSLGALPLGLDFRTGKLFFRYERLYRPFTVPEAQQVLVEFVATVVKAIQCIHGHRIAHMDIRLENICFRRQDGIGTAVLIDFDRSEDVNKKIPGEIVYGDSTMYKVGTGNSSWTCENTDWRQLAILIIAVKYRTGGRKYVGYHQLEANATDPSFIYKLYDAGE